MAALLEPPASPDSGGIRLCQDELSATLYAQSLLHGRSGFEDQVVFVERDAAAVLWCGGIAEAKSQLRGESWPYS